MPIVSAVHSDLELFDDDVLTDPYPCYRELRDMGPVVYLERSDLYALARYREVRNALIDWQTFSSAQGVGFCPVANQIQEHAIIGQDPPVHAGPRRILASQLSVAQVRRFQSKVEDRANQLVQELVERKTFDAITDLAQAFPSMVVTDLIGLPPEMGPDLVKWGEAAFNCAGPFNDRLQAGLPLLDELFAVLNGLKKKDFKEGSLGWSAFEAAERGDLAIDEIVMMLFNYTGPGIDTTISALGTLIWQLAEHADQWQTLKGEPELIPAACNEAIRFDAPVQRFTRFLQRDWTSEGVTVPAGTRVVVLYGSANRDERHYPRPDEFDVRRNPTDHLGFGQGIHLCVGANLARVQMHAVLAALMRSVTKLDAEPPVRKPNNIARMIEHLPVVVS